MIERPPLTLTLALTLPLILTPTLTLTPTPTLTLTPPLTLTLTLTNPYQVIDEQAVEARKKKRLDEIKKGTWQGWGKK